MVWAAFDRAVRAVEEYGLPGHVERVAPAARRRSATEVLEQGFDAERNTFTQHYDTTEVDASLLVLPLVGFIDGDDPRMLGTIAAIEEDLMRDGLLLRYRTETGVDGLPGDEHPFLACSFWLVSAYAAAGPRSTTRTRSSTGWWAWSTTSACSPRSTTPRSGRMVGNFPQAFSHLALVQAAFDLAGR